MSAWVFTAVVGICGALTFALALTSASAPKAAAPAARAPLAITTQGHMVEDRGGLKVLTVYGSIENTTAVPLAMPGVQVEVLSGGRRVVLGEVPPGSDLIAPGEARAFSARAATCRWKSVRPCPFRCAAGCCGPVNRATRISFTQSGCKAADALLLDMPIAPL